MLSDLIQAPKPVRPATTITSLCEIVRAASRSALLVLIRLWPAVRRRNTMTGGHRRILVVEDDPETAGQVVESLTTGGYQVELATSGNEALSRRLPTAYPPVTVGPTLPAHHAHSVIRP